MDYHYPVMLKEVGQYIGNLIQKRSIYLDTQNSDLASGGSSGVVMFDGTLGHAGHLIHLMKMYGDSIEVYIATDADPRMFQVAQQRVDTEIPERKHKVKLVNNSYIRLSEISQELGKKYDVIFLDLGVNLWHFKQHERGFSIKGDGDLDMRYNDQLKLNAKAKQDHATENQELGLTAADILNTYTEKQLIDMFVLNSEISLPTSTKLAEEIVRMRKNKPRKTSTELNKLTMKLNYSARVAAIVFQALRIEVNQEFQNIKSAIEKSLECLNPGGIVMILSYHSAEDRIVKDLFKGYKDKGYGILLTKHAIPPSYHEVQKNKPSRSARLRVFQYNK